MERLHLEPTGSSPLVDFDPESGLLRLSGESYPENALEFYRPLLDWVTAFLERDDRPLTLELDFAYLNTSSIKSLMDLLDDLDEAHQCGRSVTLRWYYAEENERALELAEEFREDLGLPFHLIPVKS